MGATYDAAGARRRTRSRSAQMVRRCLRSAFRSVLLIVVACGWVACGSSLKTQAPAVTPAVPTLAQACRFDRSSSLQPASGRRPGRDADGRGPRAHFKAGQRELALGHVTPRSRSSTRRPGSCWSRRTADAPSRGSASTSIGWSIGSAPTRSRRSPKATASPKKRTNRRPSTSCSRSRRPLGCA